MNISAWDYLGGYEYLLVLVLVAIFFLWVLHLRRKAIQDSKVIIEDTKTSIDANLEFAKANLEVAKERLQMEREILSRLGETNELLKQLLEKHNQGI